MSKPAPVLQHGTRHMYGKYKCRCRPCKDAEHQHKMWRERIARQYKNVGEWLTLARQADQAFIQDRRRRGIPEQGKRAA